MDREALHEMTVAELREMAKKIPDAKGLSSMKKDELIDLILASVGDAGGADKPSKPEKAAPKAKAGEKAPTTGRGTLGKSDIKQRIKLLKAEKREALSQDDRKRARECNREIHHYKHLLRRMTHGD